MGLLPIWELLEADDVSLKGGSIPNFDPGKVRETPKLAEIQRRCDSSRPLGMFRSTETDFLLVYDCEWLNVLLRPSLIVSAFGVFVDRYILLLVTDTNPSANETVMEIQRARITLSNGKAGPTRSLSTRHTSYCVRRHSSRSGTSIPLDCCRFTRAATYGLRGSESYLI